ncbi:MAG TPA: hypothetical protein PKU83_00230 [Chryseolinea sp.]|nr:hypothetical protein [Chryseolinea sp.]
MNPWLTIWTKTSKTIDYLKDSSWGDSFGIIPFTLFGINSIGVKLMLSFSGSPVFGMVITIVLGFAIGIIGGFVWTNILFLFGKIWKGQSTRPNIKTVLALALIPEIFRFINLIGSSIVNHEDPTKVTINDGLELICIILGFRIIIIGLSRVQHFSFGFAVLNVFTP